MFLPVYLYNKFILKYINMQICSLCLVCAFKLKSLDVKHYCCKCSLRICGMLFVVCMIRWIYLIENCFSNYKCVEMVVFFGQRIFLQLNYQIWSVKKLFVWIPFANKYVQRQKPDVGIISNIRTSRSLCRVSWGHIPSWLIPLFSPHLFLDWRRRSIHQK